MNLSKISIFFIIVFLFLLSACEDTSAERSEMILERPIKAIFFCTEQTDASEFFIPTSQCSDSSVVYSVVLSSSKGELALIDLNDKKLSDLDKYRTGYNLLGIGENAIDMVLNDTTGEISILLTSPARLVTVKIEDLLKKSKGEIPQNPILQTRYIHTSEGNISANPSSLIYYPNDVFFITFPRCGMLAKVDSNAQITDSWSTADSTDILLNTGSQIQCPSENSYVEAAAPILDASAFASLLPISITTDASTLYVGFKGDANTNLIARIQISETEDSTILPPLVFEGTPKGFKSLKISPDTRWGKFLYAVTIDGDVRVFKLNEEIECDTNTDLKNLNEELTIESELRGCIPIGTYPRDILSTTPGIHLNYGRKFSDVTFFKYDASEDSFDLKSKKTFNGIFAVLLSQDGLLYAVNLDETFNEELFEYRYGPTANDNVWAEEVLAHRIRNYTDLASGSQNSGRPYMNDIFYYKIDRIGHEYQSGEPTLKKFDSNYFIENINGYLIRTETWDLTYKGSLPYTTRNSGILDYSTDSTTLTMHDQGATFCKSGVKTGDIVKLIGCFDDNDCEENFSCARSPMQRPETNGICMPTDAKSSLLNACSRLLASDKEYRIVSVKNNEVILEPNPLYTEGETEPHQCNSDEDCRNLGYENGGVCFNSSYCVSAPLPYSNNQSCLMGTLNYEIRIDDGFFMLGGVTPYISPFKPDSNGNCIYKNEENTFDYRISATAGRQITPFFDFNLYMDPTLQIPPYYTVQFTINTGFSRYSVDAGIRLPSWIGFAPDNNIYVLDEGDSSYGYLGQMLKFSPKYFAMDASFAIR